MVRYHVAGLRSVGELKRQGHPIELQAMMIFSVGLY